MLQGDKGGREALPSAVKSMGESWLEPGRPESYRSRLTTLGISAPPTIVESPEPAGETVPLSNSSDIDVRRDCKDVGDVVDGELARTSI
jgi:hypothetical protein